MAVHDPSPRTSEGRHPQVTSLSLLARIRENDSDAWTRLTRLYEPLVSYWVTRQGVAESDREDVVQEVFQAASTSLQNFRKVNPDDTFRGWLRGISRNTVLMHFRKAGKQPRASGGTEAYMVLQNFSEPAELEEESPAQLSELYHRALTLVRTEFEDVTWTAFWRVVVDGQSPSVVAQEMGVSAAAIRQAKSRILRRLKQEVGELIQ